MAINETIFALKTGRVTDRTPVFIQFQGNGFLSELVGFNSIEDARVAFKIVRDQRTYNGAPVNYARVVAGDRVVYRGSL